MTDGAIVAFRNRLRDALDANAIGAALTDAVRRRLCPAFVRLVLDQTPLSSANLDGSDTAAISLADPLIAYVLRHSDTVSLSAVPVESPTVSTLRDAGADLLVPLVSQGVFVGLLVLGCAESGADYTDADRMLLDDLAALAAPAFRIAWLTHRHEASERAWESNAEELRIAQVIQRGLLPKELPNLSGWQISAHYQPARVLGGDLYDFIPLPGDLIAIVFGDATDKSVPAALTMATARTLLRASGQRLVLPGLVLSRVNEALAAQLPTGTYVTCLYALLDPASGRLRYANAGQTVPYRCGPAGAAELRARGWPLGMMPETAYEEQETILAPGETLLFYSDGLVETHAPDRDMFGTPRLAEILGTIPAPVSVIDRVLAAHADFAGPEWSQEDDLTLVTLTRLADAPPPNAEAERLLLDLSLPSEPATERIVVERVAAVAAELGLPERQRERLTTAVAETVMNATEHGNQNRPDRPVGVQVLASSTIFRVRITDQGTTPIPEPAAPNLEAKLAGFQSPRGWGLFLIRNMVDEMHSAVTDQGHTVELVLRLGSREQTAPAEPAP
jgi:serine phosphatase RsbU (regulator of sigma subunit)/anti-sigma regulatory factor (Ser/Thr protein kinase)